MREVLTGGLESIETGVNKAVAAVRSQFAMNNQVMGTFSLESQKRFLEVGLAKAGPGGRALLAEGFRRLEPLAADGVLVVFKGRLAARMQQVQRVLAQEAAAQRAAASEAGATRRPPAAATARGKGMSAPGAGVHVETRLGGEEDAVDFRSEGLVGPLQAHSVSASGEGGATSRSGGPRAPSGGGERGEVWPDGGGTTLPEAEWGH